MKVRRAKTERRRRRVRLLAVSTVALTLVGIGLYKAGATEAPTDKAATKATIDGKELFLREWLPGDPRSTAGDGLGPVFNESSCVSCHNQGGAGGGGPESKNVDIVSAFQNQMHHAPHFGPTLPELLFRGVFGNIGQPAVNVDQTQEAAREAAKQAREQAKQELVRLHPGFASARSVVLHRFGTDEGYENWRSSMSGMNSFMVQTFDVAVVEAEVGAEEVASAPDQQSDQQLQRRMRAQQELQLIKTNLQQAQFGGRGATQVGNFALLQSQRNPTALFGSGAIDSVTDQDLIQAAEKKYDDYPEISGRVAKLKDGKLGRFGWKAQTATLRDFTLTACAVELGLNVPGHDQAGVPQRPDYKAPGLDLTADECNALEGYLRDLPAPERRAAANKDEAKYLEAGEAHFAKVGCAACHSPQLGQVAGLYSDLLLHDMGNDLGDTGQYGVFVPNESEEEQFKEEEVESFAQSQQQQQREPTAEELKNTVGALRQEWRTPPLWGVRDSAPYLHDGRAETLEEAIALHGGEGAASAQRYFELSGKERMQLVAFLRSLTAPSDTQLAKAE